jgi:tRNA-Thr(GGU) m(6)t(6)A37 methyltransferase TsaA
MVQQEQGVFWMEPIGRVRRKGAEVVLQIEPRFRPGLEDLDQFSHVMVFWWADEFDNEWDRARLHIKPPYAPDRAIGVFATRSPFRPNPIAMTTCPILDVDTDAGRLTVGDIDAFDGTKVIDLKAYLPICDRVKAPQLPSWFADWPTWMPETGTRLQDPKA